MSESLNEDGKSKYEKTNRTIMQASLYLAAFAVLESAVISAVELFYGVKDSSDPKWKNYISEVLIFTDDTYESSCVWMLKRGAINEQYYRALIDCRQRRESIARGFSEILFQDVSDWNEEVVATTPPKKVEFEEQEFEVMVDLMHRIEAWRVRIEYGLTESDEHSDLESILPVSVIGMMRIASLAFPTNTES